MILLFISCLSTLPVEKEAQANTWCYLGNKTKYNFLVDTYNGSNKTGGNRALGSNSSPSMAFNKGQKIAGRPNGGHGKTFAGICSQDKMYVVEENGAIFLQ